MRVAGSFDHLCHPGSDGDQRIARTGSRGAIQSEFLTPSSTDI